MDSNNRNKVFAIAASIALLAAFFSAWRWLKPKTESSSPNQGLVARICGKPVTDLAFNEVLNGLKTEFVLKTGQFGGHNEEQLRLQAYRKIRNDMLLECVADREGIKVSGEELKEAQNKVLEACRKIVEGKDISDDVCLQQIFRLGGESSKDAFLKSLKYQLLEKKLSEQLVPKARPSAEEINKYMPTRRVQQIYRPGGPVGGEKTDAAVAEAERIKLAYAKLKKGEDFAALAKKYSIEPAGAEGGDIGWVREKDMEPAWWSQLLKLKLGEFSEPFQTRWGWHIIKCLEILTPEDEKYQKLEKIVADFLELYKRQSEFASQMTRKELELEQNGDVELYDNLLNAVTYYWTGDLTTALEYYKKAAEDNPRNPFVHIRMAEIYFKRREIDKANSHYLMATQLAPSNAQVFLAICMGKISQGLTTLSDRRYCEQASKLAELDSDLHLKLAQVYAQLGWVDEADAETQKANEAYVKRYRRGMLKPEIYSAEQGRETQDMEKNLKTMKDSFEKLQKESIEGLQDLQKFEPRGEAPLSGQETPQPGPSFQPNTEDLEDLPPIGGKE